MSETQDRPILTLADRKDSLFEEDSMRGKSFQLELEALINRWSMEGGSNTPDWILAQYLKSCLDSYNKAVQNRALWYTAK
jgi:hypothetical protein